MVHNNIINMIKISQYADKLRENHLFQEDTSDCGPYVIAMSLNAMSVNAFSGIDISREMNASHWLFFIPLIMRIPSWATFPWGITWYVRRKGLQSNWHIFATRNSLIDNINKPHLQIVLVGGYKPLWAHYKILVAYDEATDEFGFIDPGSPLSNIVWQKSAVFYNEWRHYGRLRVIIKDPSSIGISPDVSIYL